MVRFGSRSGAVKREIPFGFAQGRLSPRLKRGFAQDDNRRGMVKLHHN